MPPKRGQSIERNEDHDAFLDKLRAYHKKRGTNLDTEPKVGIRHVDLYRLYERVVEEGGYDLCSDTKAKPLMWRKLAEEFVGKNQYSAAQAFQIKNVYYKNLCAYEISTHWSREPPPKEILEDVTAKGGNVMTRTLENFIRPAPRESDVHQNGDVSDDGGEQRTPKEERVEGGEEPGSATGRSRSLRQQPPQRVLFQPDVSSARQPRSQSQQAQQHVSSTHGSATLGIGLGMHGPSHSSFSDAASATLASYEPPQSYPLSLRPVTTPANNSEYYRLERKRKAEARSGPLAKKYRNIMLPGTGFIGPNIYVRAQLALQSGIADEERYALHHLVKISHERGDKYRFDQFPGLVEALVKKVLHVSTLFYDVEWEIGYDPDQSQLDEETLDGLNGTADVLQRLYSRVPLTTDDGLQDEEFVSQIGRITEASLIIRNMCLQVENAQHLARQPMAQDYFAIILGLPTHPSIAELRHYVLDTAEQVLVWCNLDADGAVYENLVKSLWSDDRGTLTAALKIIARFGMHLPLAKKLDYISPKVLERIQSWLMIDDEELRSACLDFLFQYTSFSENVAVLCHMKHSAALTQQLSRLLLSGAKEERSSEPVQHPPSESIPASVPKLSRGLVETLLQHEEPARSSEWLRMCFLPDPACEMTQISLWQAYQGTFGPFNATHPHLIAGDFIKNVSNTFTSATAQVAGTNKYVIKGIRARRTPVDTGTLAGAPASDRTRELHRCCWASTVTSDMTPDPLTGIASKPAIREVDCSEWFRQSDDILRHILRDHLRIQPQSSASLIASQPGEDRMDVDGKPNGVHTAMNNGISAAKSANMFDFANADQTQYHCRWGRCGRRASDFDTRGTKASRTALFARHIQTHLPDMSLLRKSHNLQPISPLRPLTGGKVLYKTTVDERGEAAGINLSAALILRNIAKFITSPSPTTLPVDNPRPFLNGGSDKSEVAKRDAALIAEIFNEEVMEHIFFAVSHSRTMYHAIGLVLASISQSLQGVTSSTEKKDKEE